MECWFQIMPVPSIFNLLHELWKILFLMLWHFFRVPIILNKIASTFEINKDVEEIPWFLECVGFGSETWLFIFVEIWIFSKSIAFGFYQNLVNNVLFQN